VQLPVTPDPDTKTNRVTGKNGDLPLPLADTKVVNTLYHRAVRTSSIESGRRKTLLCRHHQLFGESPPVWTVACRFKGSVGQRNLFCPNLSMKTGGPPLVSRIDDRRSLPQRTRDGRVLKTRPDPDNFASPRHPSWTPG